jgi:hypothetical protein
MILTVTDTLQTTGGPLLPGHIYDDERYFYGFIYRDGNHSGFAAVPSKYSGNQYVNSAMLIGLSSGTYATIPWDYDVLLANGDSLPAHELTTGTKVAYFTRVMRHEKYSAMRVVPFMPDRVLEHRWVWETHNGMSVPPTHNVDHINADTYDNSYTNLRALDIRSHSRMTAYRQRNRHTRRNADGSFAKGSTTKRIASADMPIPEHLSTGKITGAVRVVSMEEATLDNYYFQWEVNLIPEDYIIMGNLCVAPTH